jgi:hypothetical protein
VSTGIVQVETDLRNLGCNLIQTAGKLLKLPQVRYTTASVGDLGPQDPLVFRPPGSGSVSQRSGSFLFRIKVLSRLK